ncbi:acyl transferase/acyl hydrolase/lysophospholipase [Lineolata rhizophorae]|uniref:Acyl transferase/acyl hydrolase/lysophospholipase n=1 Tax=Lineolata rhizophorae TaxID=578093 RepID=A0A6A6P0Z6_9PEZI|nr:acyl transferase/acyl hydrolase/lysophospholipase [Lineolata rhizophorae]
MDSTGLRRKDTTKGPPLRILSLDGGGVRGYSMLILLQELMHRTFVETEGRAPKRHEIPKPCEHFDLIAGTGTGGLIAIMLGRLRMDIETCKDVYVRMTKRVFETDKTIAGIPYRSTLFKASKLEEAIRDCVREHTITDEEGNDIAASQLNLSSPRSPVTSASSFGGAPVRTMSNASRYSQYGMSPVYRGPSAAAIRWGNPNALLYDTRENRTKCAVTAVYRGTPKNGSSVLLRSYDSRKEPAPEFDCTIWQAGRATSATGLAFKPIQVGQSVFIDEGAGKYNPAPQILDEAVCNEWPGRDVGVFVSIGTGKRPPGTNNQQHLWWEGFVSSGMGDFAEARRRLIAKIEGCEDTHQYMLRDHLSKRHVNPENYYRLNVEVGVGEFGMNEWNRLAEISTNTRMYLARQEVQSINISAAAKIARIHRAKIRWERAQAQGYDPEQFQASGRPLPPIPSQTSPPPPSNPMAVELPAEDVPPSASSPRLRPVSQLLTPSDAASYEHHYNGGYDSHDHAPPHKRAHSAPHHHQHRHADEKYAVVSSDEYPQPVDTAADSAVSSLGPSPRRSAEDARRSGDHPRRSGEHVGSSPPPRPPKTPLPAGENVHAPPPPPPRNHAPPPPPPGNPASHMTRPPKGINVLPYPDSDGPPPMVDRSRKPNMAR